MLSKFPVISRSNQEYLVSIKDKYVGCGICQWIVELHRKSDYLSWITRKTKAKFKLIYTWESGWNHYNDWDGRFKEMAMMVVDKYEREFQEAIDREKRHNESIIEFNNWDGKCQ